MTWKFLHNKYLGIASITRVTSDCPVQCNVAKDAGWLCESRSHRSCSGWAIYFYWFLLNICSFDCFLFPHFNNSLISVRLDVDTKISEKLHQTWMACRNDDRIASWISLSQKISWNVFFCIYCTVQIIFTRLIVKYYYHFQSTCIYCKMWLILTKSRRLCSVPPNTMLIWSGRSLLRLDSRALTFTGLERFEFFYKNVFLSTNLIL